ncbi:MAG: DUF99 family protein [Sandaracinaceae bacterium]
MPRRFSNVLGVDDSPFERTHRGDVPIVGAVFTRTRLDGVLRGKIRRDGVNSTPQLARLLTRSPFAEHVQLVMTNGIAFGGFNVLDVQALSDRIARPVLVVSKKEPDLLAIRRALITRVPGGEAKWKRIVRAGPMEPVEGVWVQRAGLSLAQAAQAIRDTRVQGRLPEPLRVAHLIAGAFVTGTSTGGA